jgi:DNA-directed RNA polymerase subunit alpha
MIDLPSKIYTVKEDGNKAIIAIEGLYPNYGITIGNSLRRVLLSSLKGSAVTYVKIKNVAHEFSTLDGVYETVIDIMLSLKNLKVKMFTNEPQVLTLKAKGEKEITAKDFDKNSQVEIENKDLQIATITDKNTTFEMEVTIEKGVGYKTSEDLKKEKLPVGTLLNDAIFSPVLNVSFEIEDMSLKGRVDYNRLLMNIETDGIITPKEALKEACGILKDHFEGIIVSLEGNQTTKKIEKQELVKELNLSDKVIKLLEKNDIKKVSQLTNLSLSELKEIDGLGPKAAKEITDVLENQGYSLKN